MDHLDDTDHGLWKITTETSTYLVDLQARRMMRIPGAPHVTPARNIVLLSQLAGDQQWLPLVQLLQCRLGAELIAVTEDEADGNAVYRQSTFVRAIQPFGPEPENHDAGADTPGGPRYYDRTGTPIDIETLTRHLDDPDYRFLARTRVGALEVVTAWLGIDQALDRAGAPLIFGTAILVDTDTGQLFDDREYLASTEEEAMAQHQVLADRLRRDSG